MFGVCLFSVSDTAEIFFLSPAPPRLKVRSIVASFVANVPANRRHFTTEAAMGVFNKNARPVSFKLPIRFLCTALLAAVIMFSPMTLAVQLT